MEFAQFDFAMGGHINDVWQHLLGLCYPMMKSWSLVDQMYALVKRTMYNRRHKECFLNVIEYFAGSARLTAAMLQADHCPAAFDALFRREHNCLLAHGLRLWIDAIAATKQRTLSWFGTKCASFVVLSSSQAGRSSANGYRGFPGRPFVEEGNGLAEVMALLWMISYFVSNICCLEQPLSSVLPLTSSMASVLAFTQAHKVVTFSGAYGSRSRKPLQIWSTSRDFEALVRHKPDWLGSESDALTIRGAEGSFTGKSEEVTDSGHYPPLFCAEVTKIYGELLNSNAS